MHFIFNPTFLDFKFMYQLISGNYYVGKIKYCTIVETLPFIR